MGGCFLEASLLGCRGGEVCGGGGGGHFVGWVGWGFVVVLVCLFLSCGDMMLFEIVNRFEVALCVVWRWRWP